MQKLRSGSEDEVFDNNKTGVEWGQANWGVGLVFIVSPLISTTVNTHDVANPD